MDTNTPGTYVLNYTATNRLGGIATPVSRTVVVLDTLPPVIIMLGNNPMILTNAQPFSDPGAAAVNLCGGSFAVTSSNNVNVNSPGVYSVVYQATGNYGYSSSATRTVYAVHPPAAPGDQNGDGIVSQSELDAVYASYVPNSPWLFMTNVAGLGGTNVTFSLSNSVLGAYSVEYTTNLTDWYLLGPASPRYLFTDTNAPALPQRSYRLRYP